MIGISTLTQNIDGDIVIYEKPSSVLRDVSARISRTKTLDGGVYINHYGVSDGDRTFDVIAELSEDDIERIMRIYKAETFVFISTADGFYKAAISSVRQKKSDTYIKILINSKESI